MPRLIFHRDKSQALVPRWWQLSHTLRTDCTARRVGCCPQTELHRTLRKLEAYCKPNILIDAISGVPYPPPTAPVEEFPSLQLPMDFDVIKHIWNFPKGTACGPSGLRIEHLQEACGSPLPTSLHSTFRMFLNVLLTGTLPPETSPYFAGASLVALRKTRPDEPLDVRPIAVGEVFRRLVGKCVCHITSQKAREILQPAQFGVACPLGTEKVVHQIHDLISEHWDNDDFAFMKVDYKNAFNSVSRQLVINECQKHFPELIPWVMYCYGRHPKLWHSSGIFLSACGVQQGDPLGPLLFALALRALVNEIGNVEGVISNKWYLDDGMIAGTKAAVQRVLSMMQTATVSNGLSLNLAKCELFSKNDLSEFPPECRKCTEPNMEILGAPIGSDTYCDNIVGEKQSARKCY